MTRYDTPSHIAELLAAHAPKGCRSVLDPAVGAGNLIKPFLNGATPPKVECIDIDTHATAELVHAHERNRLMVHTDDFLEWSAPGRAGSRKRFDCIVMNPPFAGTRDKYVRIQRDPLTASYVPIEAAFVFRAMRLLKKQGRILAIVPASVVSGTATEWLRREMMYRGYVRLIHELPNWTFSGIDGKIYILVYERAEKQRALAICNHRLVDPDVIRVPAKFARTLTRWDFGFVSAHNEYRQRMLFEFLGWARIGDIAEVARGSVESPIRKVDILHTTNLVEAFRRPKQKKAVAADVYPGDIVLARVGRRCSSTPVIFRGPGKVRASDCILRIRPAAHIDSIALLFSLRVLVGSEKGAALIERGVGARYITVNDLQNFHVPLRLAESMPKLFQKFRMRVKKRHWNALAQVEFAARKALRELSSKGSSSPH